MELETNADDSRVVPGLMSAYDVPITDPEWMNDSFPAISRPRMNIEISEAMESTDFEKCREIRVEVFCGEQQVSSDIEFDGLDHLCRHYLARDEQIPVGTARARPLERNVVKIERVAVVAPRRRCGFGQALMEKALEDARQDGYLEAVLNSQCEAAGFYERLGFRREGEEFLDAGIPHIRMTRVL